MLFTGLLKQRRILIRKTGLNVIIKGYWYKKYPTPYKTKKLKYYNFSAPKIRNNFWYTFILFIFPILR